MNDEYKRSTEHAIHDYSLPAFVRAKLVLLSLNATYQMVLGEAKVGIEAYAKHEGKPCKITLASVMGDIGISYNMNGDRYNKRDLSVYDLTDFSETPHPGMPK